jgi:hypothetical protein
VYPFLHDLANGIWSELCWGISVVIDISNL